MQSAYLTVISTTTTTIILHYSKMLWYADQLAVLRAHIAFTLMIWLIRVSMVDEYVWGSILQCIQYIHIFIVCLRSIAGFLVDKVDFFGRLNANICYTLMNKANIVCITPGLYKTDMKNIEWLQHFTKKLYWDMINDECRMKTYTEGVMQAPKNLHFVDIGCGAHIPLTKMVIEKANASLVDAIDGNKNAFASATSIIEQDEHLANNVRFHGCYTTELDKNCLSPAPTAIIHELIGVIASDEGMLNIIADVQNRLIAIDNQDKSKSIIIPQLVKTIGYPCAPPKLSLLSQMLSFVYPGFMYAFTETLGVTSVKGHPCNFTTKLAETAEFEHFDFAVNSVESMMVTDTTRYYVVKKAGVFAGLMLSCIVQAHPKASVCNGLTSNTNWGAYFVRLVPKKDYDLAHVLVGNIIKVRFQNDAKKVEPSYSITATITNKTRKSISKSWCHSWKGPVGTIEYFPC